MEEGKLFFLDSIHSIILETRCVCFLSLKSFLFFCFKRFRIVVVVVFSGGLIALYELYQWKSPNATQLSQKARIAALFVTRALPTPLPTFFSLPASLPPALFSDCVAADKIFGLIFSRSFFALVALIGTFYRCSVHLIIWLLHCPFGDFPRRDAT